MKTFRVITTEFALNDLQLAKAFYENQSKELGNYFFNTLVTDIESLTFYAGIHLQVGGFYKMFSKRFPYSIYYDVLFEDTARVIAVLDQRRNPIVHYEELANRKAQKESY